MYFSSIFRSTVVDIQDIGQLMELCRKKAKVILVGDVGLNLKRSDFYAKELDFLIIQDLVELEDIKETLQK